METNLFSNVGEGPAVSVAGAPACIRTGEVHLFQINLDPPEAVVDSLAWHLSDEERARAWRMRLPQARRRFTVAHGALNLLLSRYLCVPPSQFRLRRGPGGKPSLGPCVLPFWQDCQKTPDLRFNISHSGGRALLAFALGREVGVDLEEMRDDLLMTNLALLFLSPRERAWFFSLPADERQSAFFQCWTLKEAYLKACGQGLARPLESFDAFPREGRVHFAVPGQPEERGQWSLIPLALKGGFRAALAVEGQQFQLKVC